MHTDSQHYVPLIGSTCRSYNYPLCNACLSQQQQGMLFFLTTYHHAWEKKKKKNKGLNKNYFKETKEMK